MKIKSLIIGLLSLVLFSSCSTFRKLSANDISASQSTKNKKTNTTATRGFINEIEVSPGSVVTANPTYVKSTVKTDYANPISQTGVSATDEKMKVVTIETVNLLQLKYAIITDATVEKLVNLPLLEVIDKWWGTKYCMGGSTDNCIDCSAFTQVIMRDVYQQSLPRTAQEQFNSCEKIALEDLREGDLVFFTTVEKDISHVGIYLLNNKFVHAATSGGVMISDLNENYWQGKFKGAGRMERKVLANNEK